MERDTSAEKLSQSSDEETEAPFIHGTLGDKWAQEHFETECPEIEPHEIIRGEKIGDGTFGVVYKGQCRGEIVAVKELKNATIENIEEFRKEVAIMSHLRHRNIVLLMGACTQKGHFCIVTEFLPCGDLDKFLKEKDKEFPLIEKLRILKDVALAMNWLHCSRPPIIHKDLKPSNIMMTSDMTPKVGDMGLSAVQEHKDIEGDGAGSYLWMAPEALLCKSHSEKVDIYSFGIVMWQMMAWIADPYKKYLDQGDLGALIEAVCSRKERPDIPSDVHPSLVDIIEKTWHDNPDVRPSFQDIIVLLDDALISTSFVDETAAKFWKKQWGGKVDENKIVKATKLSVGFDKFASALYTRLGLRLPSLPEDNKKYLCLKALASDPRHQKPTVTIERFSLLTKWFGSLIHEDFKTIVDDIHDIVACQWFHGDISKEEAVTLLSPIDEKTRKFKPGTFLVRLSTSEPVHSNPFTITKLNSQSEIVHQRINFKDGKYFISVKDKTGNRELASTKGLIFLIEEIMKTKFVKYPAPRSKYSTIFAKLPKPADKGYQDNMEKYS
eukprot:TRINITY_DN8888_c0_g1_i1.p1 TRINITY_DN8888_c0_g1~~TRINITY_DN8888_c0_g1_i1.p1  ORF type:complete len:552 (+),score=115.55 TRINITY_DN8888_c0_g1_i1:38-1693(+)